MEKEALKEQVCRAIDGERERIVSVGRRIDENPELGFKEHRTAALIKEQLERLGLSCRSGIALTGVRADVEGRAPGRRIAVLGELDAVVCPGHPRADPSTGAAHACGHNAQIAAMLGVAIGLTATGAAAHLGGGVAFLAVPAEEFVELEYRQALAERGKIRFFGGKQELVRLGEFDDIDLAMMVHAKSEEARARVYLNTVSSAFIGKAVRFRGREAHAGAAPETGINALNAAALALMGIHAQRETFRDEDGIRVHPILTKGGDLVNIVPADVRMETYVRGLTIPAVIDAGNKVNRAIRGAAYMVGAAAEIAELPGYLPLDNSSAMAELFAANSRALLGAEAIAAETYLGGSTDMGDISCLMPALHPFMGGFLGAAHSSEYRIADEDAAYIVPAKAMAMTVIDLLWDGAAQAEQICGSFTPAYSRREYIKLLEGIARDDGESETV